MQIWSEGGRLRQSRCRGIIGDFGSGQLESRFQSTRILGVDSARRGVRVAGVGSEGSEKGLH